MTDAVILSACRTPIGSFGGTLKDLSSVDLGAIVIREAIRRAGVKAGDVGDVIMGCVLQAGAGMNVARQAIQTVLDLHIPHDASVTSSEVTVSIGVAAAPVTTGMSESTLIKAADAALYRAKADGRNRICS